MRIFEQEVNARERVSASSVSSTPRKIQSRMPTMATLVASHSGQTNGGVGCVYCGQGHPSSSCNAVTDVAARKEVLRKAGRCYVCLRKHHISRECRLNLSCRRCRGRHHVTICYCRGPEQGTNAPTPQGSPQEPSNETPSGHGSVQRPTNALYTGAQTPMLLQTARLQLFNLNAGRPRTVARAIMDSGSQRTYITYRLRDELNLQTMGTETLRIKTFGTTESHNALCDVVQLGIHTKDSGTLKMTALVVPVICHSLTSQPISHSRECYHHLLDLELADSANVSDVLEVDVLIGSNSYWDLATRRIIRGGSGPTAIHTRVGWVLSGPADQQEGTANLIVASMHTLKVDAYPEPTLDDCLRQSWELESLGITKDETSVYEKFVQQIRFNGWRYEVNLPWKEQHLPLPDHLNLCRKRLASLLKRLRQTPQLLDEYNAIIQDQLDKGIVEVVIQPVPAVSDPTHYLPQHGVVPQDKATSKLRIVYDASARSTGPSLNDCLYTGPKFGQSILDILLRFRLQRVALAGDIEKAFLMVSVHERDRDSLRFLWAADLRAETTEVITLRFNRVVFGVSSSPFLLNVTINHHMETYCNDCIS